MANHVTPRVTPVNLNWRRFGRNGQVASGPAFNRAAYAMNHAAKYMPKCFLFVSNLHSVPTPATAARTGWLAYGITGEGVTRVRANIGLAICDNGSSTGPYVYIAQTISGGATTNSDELHYSAIDTAVSDVYPGDIFHGSIDLEVTPNTAYEWSLSAQQYARPVYMTLTEIPAGTAVDDTVTGNSNPAAFTNEAPIYDSSMNVISNATKLWQHNASPLLAWTGPFTTTASPYASTRTANTYAAQTNIGEYVIPIVRYRGTRMRDLPCIFAAHGSTSSGSTNGVELIDTDTSTQLAEITGFTTSSTWRTDTLTLDRDTRSVTVRFKSDGAATFSLWAYTLLQYET